MLGNFYLSSVNEEKPVIEKSDQIVIVNISPKNVNKKEKTENRNKFKTIFKAFKNIIKKIICRNRRKFFLRQLFTIKAFFGIKFLNDRKIS